MTRFPFPSQYEQGGVYEIPLMLRNADPAYIYIYTHI